MSIDPPVLEVNLVPFGNADVKNDGSFECQHGPKECLANAIAGERNHWRFDS
jgi:hypothetical protein